MSQLVWYGFGYTRTDPIGFADFYKITNIFRPNTAQKSSHPSLTYFTDIVIKKMKAHQMSYSISNISWKAQSVHNLGGHLASDDLVRIKCRIQAITSFTSRFAHIMKQ